MKKTKVLSISVSILALTIMGITFSIKNEIKEADAYSTSSLPTTIDLNDTSEANIRKYYSSLNSLDESERKGTNLLKNLKPILENGQKYYSYDSGNTVWQMYEITDRDWDKSPASSTTYGTYNSAKNIITGYTYGTSNTNGKNNPYVHALYINRNVENETLAWGNHQQNKWGINREHVWPKSIGFETTAEGGARGDPMHLMAGNGYSNNIHSNHFYGYVDTSKTYVDCGDTHDNQWGNLRGSSKTRTSDNATVFEPQDCDKGDIARAVFYMVARYNYLSGSDSDGINSNNPNLEIVQNVYDLPTKGYDSSTSSTGKMGVLTDLLAWHHADPVDEYEIHRNNLLYTNFTNNRNPFIDFPEWVDYIWGTASYSGSTYQSYNSTPTGAANPSSDVVNGYLSASDSISINKSSSSIEVSDTETLNATSSDGSTISWTTSNSSIATISVNSSASGTNITVTGIAAGNATITASATINDKVYQKTCLVTVKPASGGTFNATMIPGANSTSTTVNGTDGVKVGTSNNSGSLTITVGARAAELTFYAASWYNASNLSIDITGATVSPSSIALTSDSGITGNSNFTTSGDEETFKFTVALSNITKETVLTITPADAKRFVIWGAKCIIPNEINSITATATKTYKVGETISKDDIVVEGNDGSLIDNFTFANDGYEFTYADAASGGTETEKEFIVSYQELETTLTVKVYREEYYSPEGESFSLSSAEFASSDVYQGIGGPSPSQVTIGGIEFNITTNAYVFTSKTYNIRYLSFGKNIGWLSTRNPFDNDICSVTVSIKDTYRDDGECYISKDGINWEEYSLEECEKGGYRYFKYGYSTVGSNYSNINTISVELYGEDNSVNVANYIMFEDTENQCEDKYTIAVRHFGNMTIEERYNFMNGDTYVLNEARTRLRAWAKNKGEKITYDFEKEDYVINSQNLNKIPFTINNNIAIVISVIGVISISMLAFVLLKKKKER